MQTSICLRRQFPHSRTLHPDCVMYNAGSLVQKFVHSRNFAALAGKSFNSCSKTFYRRLGAKTENRPSVRALHVLNMIHLICAKLSTFRTVCMNKPFQNSHTISGQSYQTALTEQSKQKGLHYTRVLHSATDILVSYHRSMRVPHSKHNGL